MRLQQMTSPTALQVSLNALKDHLRIEREDATQDDDLRELLSAAVAYLQDVCHIQLINTQYKAYWDRFPSCGERLRVPLWPVVTIDSLTYYDTDGVSQTISDYQSDLVSAPATLRPAIYEVWPDTQCEKVNAVTLTFTAGYGTAATSIPPMVRHAIKLLVAHWYRNRESVLIGAISKPIEFALESLISQCRVNEFESFQFDKYATGENAA